MTEIAITVKDISKSFAEVKAVRHLTFSVQGGTCYGFLGPNGAGKTTMMKTSLGRFLVSSKTSRGTYAAFKGIAFSLLIIIHLPIWGDGLFKTAVTFFTFICVYIALFFCVVRGLPVIIEGMKLFAEPISEDNKQQASETNTFKTDAQTKELTH